MVIDKLIRRGLPLVAAIVLAAVFYGCAPKQTVQPDGSGEAQAGETEEAGAATDEGARLSGTKVSAVDVIGDGDAVLIESDGELNYTAFRLTDPPRVVVDMPGVTLEDIDPSTEVNSKFIGTITASIYKSGDESIARVEIGLKEGMQYDITAGENNLVVSVTSGGQAGQDEPVSPVVEPVAGGAAEPEAVVEVELPAATKISKVDTYAEGGVTFVKLAGNGTFAGKYKAFSLDGPPRLVLDVFGVALDEKKKSVAVKGKFISNVRIGAHSDKVRFVFDAAGKTMPAYNVSEQGEALVMGFGDAAAIALLSEKQPVVKKTESKPKTGPKDEPKPDVVEGKGAAPVVAPKKPKGETPSAVIAAETTVLEDYDEGKFNVRKVDVRKLKKRAMVSVEGTSKPDYVVRDSKDGRSLYVDFKNAYIPEDLRVTMDATELKTQITSVSAYQHSTAPVGIVRVLIKFKEPVQYSIKEMQRTLSLDFPFTTESAVLAAEEEEIKSEKKYTGEKVHLNLSGAEIKDVLRLIAEVSQMNVIVADEVTGTITMRLENVPWDQAFDLILASKGLDKIQEGNIIRVASIERLRKEKETALQAKASEEKLEDLFTEYIRVNYDKASDLASQIKELLSPRGTTTVHEGTNTLVIRDIASAIKEAKDYIKRVDIPTPQVLIEARIVEAASSFTRDLGVKWSGTQDTPNPNAIPTPRVTTNQSVEVDASVGSVGAIGFTLGKLGANPLNLDILLMAAETNGTIRTISKPRVVTLDNKEAKIEQGESIPFATTSAGGTETTFIDANLSLTVTPHITPDGGVSMQIKASNNSIGEFRGGGGEPSINKNEASTEVLVRDGETTVIGGIVVSKSTKSNTGVPFFMHIPVIGWLFKNQNTLESQKELLIFITPTILTKLPTN